MDRIQAGYRVTDLSTEQKLYSWSKDKIEGLALTPPPNPSEQKKIAHHELAHALVGLAGEATPVFMSIGSSDAATGGITEVLFPPANTTEDLIENLTYFSAGLAVETTENPKQPIQKTLEHASGDLIEIRRLFNQAQANGTLPPEVKPMPKFDADRFEQLIEAQPQLSSQEKNELNQLTQELFKTPRHETVQQAMGTALDIYHTVPKKRREAMVQSLMNNPSQNAWELESLFDKHISHNTLTSMQRSMNGLVNTYS